MVDMLNGLLVDPDLRENFRDNLLSYTNVMSDGRYKIGDYINAVRYMSHKLLGSSNIEAYVKTFPDRYQRLVDEGADDKTISSYCAAYNKTQLVNKVREQTLVPVYILNADIYQKAINVQAALMTDTTVSDKVRSDAANSLLTHLKQPEVTKIELGITTKEDSAIQELRRATNALAQQQSEMLSKGIFSPQEIAHSNIIEGEVVIDGVLS
jgi:glutamine synthetase type III